MDTDRLVELEREVWEALVRGDATADAALLADDFVGLYPTGFADRAAHVGQLADGATVATYRLSEVRTIAVSDVCGLVLYRADYVRTGADAVAEAMYVSSLWERRDDRWVNVFSQDTPATGVDVV